VIRSLDLGAEHQMALELRPAHDPTKAYGFLRVVVSTKDLSASIWTWRRDNGKWSVSKVIEIPLNLQIPHGCRLRSSLSRRCRRSSPTSILVLTINFYTSPAGVRASCDVMM
jgi:hypothetical protein